MRQKRQFPALTAPSFENRQDVNDDKKNGRRQTNNEIYYWDPRYHDDYEPGQGQHNSLLGVEHHEFVFFAKSERHYPKNAKIAYGRQIFIFFDVGLITAGVRRA